MVNVVNADFQVLSYYEVLLTLHLEGVPICHILKQWLQRLYHYSLSAKKWDEDIGQRKESAWSKQTLMLFGTNLTRRAQWDPPFVLVVVPQYKVARSRFVAGDQSFVLISMLRGQPKTPPSGDDFAVLDYHLKLDYDQKAGLAISPSLHNINWSPSNFLFCLIYILGIWCTCSLILTFYAAGG